MAIWIKSPLAVLTHGELDAANGLVIEGNRITELVQAGAEPTRKIDQVMDASGFIVLPGLINTHHHFYQTLTRAVPDALNKGLFPWLKSLYPIWSRLNEEMVYVSTQLACAELLLSGCTTSADHHYLFTPRIPHALDIQVEAVNQSGIRAVLTRGSMSLGKTKGGLPPDSTVQDDDEILLDCERVISKFHNPDSDAIVQIALAPCSPFSVSPSLMIESAVLARKNGVRLHTHLAETKDEETFCLEKFGQRPLEYLEELGWLSSDVWLAHGIHFSDNEIDKLGHAGVGISHCPSSNMMLGSGSCRVMELMKAGAQVGLGVDGSASNDCSNMIQEVRQAFLLHRLQYGAEHFSHIDALGLATTGASECLGRPELGKIAPNMLADLALFAIDEIRFSGSHDPLSTLVLSGAYQASHVMVNGNWVVENGTINGFDLKKLREDHTQLAQNLIEQV